jgi:splicing factor U2AF subunit
VQANEEFEDFYEEVFEEMSKFGDLEELHVCDNLGDHMVRHPPVFKCNFSEIS